jgi:hypothetical protein
MRSRRCRSRSRELGRPVIPVRPDKRCSILYCRPAAPDVVAVVVVVTARECRGDLDLRTFCDLDFQASLPREKKSARGDVHCPCSGQHKARVQAGTSGSQTGPDRNGPSRWVARSVGPECPSHRSPSGPGSCACTIFNFRAPASWTGWRGGAGRAPTLIYFQQPIRAPNHRPPFEDKVSGTNTKDECRDPELQRVRLDENAKPMCSAIHLPSTVPPSLVTPAGRSVGCCSRPTGPAAAAAAAAASHPTGAKALRTADRSHGRPKRKEDRRRQKLGQRWLGRACQEARHASRHARATSPLKYQRTVLYSKRRIQ